MRRIGVLMAHSERDTEAQSFVAALIQGLQESGWSNGKNVRIDIRWSAGDVERMRAFATELVALQPDVIVARTTPVTAAVQGSPRKIPVILVAASDPVGEGLICIWLRRSPIEGAPEGCTWCGSVHNEEI
jgi:putative ABC transport system substrate-binding protein